MILLNLISQKVSANVYDVKTVIADEAVRAGFSKDVLLAVAAIESNYNPRAVGSKGEIGLFQLMPDKLPKQYTTRTTIRLAIKELKKWQHQCPVKEDLTFVICYNQGYRKPKYPKLHPYYKKFMEAYSGLI